MNMQPARLSIIIPAAGASERLGQAKQLVHHKGKSLIRRAIENAESLTPHEILVVTGANAEAVQLAVQMTSAQCVYNADWKGGLGTSIAKGAQAVEGDSIGVMVLLCDQWRISPEDLHQLLSAWQIDTNRVICSETENRCGPPVIFPSSCLQDLRELKGDHGAHSIIEAHPDLVKPMVIQNASYDLDTPSQLDELNNEKGAGYI